MLFTEACWQRYLLTEATKEGQHRVEGVRDEFRVTCAGFDGSTEISVERTLELRICSWRAR